MNVHQIMVKVDRNAVRQYGLQVGEVANELQTFYNGQVVGQVLEGQQSFDIMLRIDDSARQNLESIRNVPIQTASGGLVPLQQVAQIELQNSINAINHENTQRRIVVSANVQGRDLGNTVKEMQQAVTQGLALPQGYYIEWGGQFESQQSASRLITILSLFSLLGIFLVLY